MPASPPSRFRFRRAVAAAASVEACWRACRAALGLGSALLAGLVLPGCAGPDAPGAPRDDPAALAPRLPGMGDHSHPISTRNAETQRFFDQGLVLHYAFNHDEALRSFREAARLDPDCAMCFWGQALTLGPNLNGAMAPEAVGPAWEALQHALHLAAGASPGERALIEALGKRYLPDAPADRAELDAAYATAMRAVADAHPDDSDAATLWAEALMATTPWDYWTPEGAPRAGTADVLGILQRAIADDPGNPGPHHFYIHAVEAVRPELALASAAALETLVPGAGHLVHMPAHIYLRLGHYHAATEANERAMAADATYAEHTHAQGLYPTLYMPHNPHFLVYTASMEGRAAYALQTARDMAARIEADGDLSSAVGTVQHYWVTPLYTMARFAMWDQVLATPEPEARLPYPRGVWRYARGLAFADEGRLPEAEEELAALQHLAADPAVAATTVWDLNTADALLGIATEVLAGEIAAHRGEFGTAIERYRAAQARQDELTYDEPPPWHFPVRQGLGAIYLEAGRLDEAEAAYRADLEQYPGNGWSLWGLWRSLDAAGRAPEATETLARFRDAWSNADYQLPAD